MRAAKKCEIINVRISENLKNESKEVLDKHGLTHSKVIRMLLEYIAKYKKLPFDEEKNNE